MIFLKSTSWLLNVANERTERAFVGRQATERGSGLRLDVMPPKVSPPREIKEEGRKRHIIGVGPTEPRSDHLVLCTMKIVMFCIE